MAFQKVEYSFPEEESVGTDIEVEDSGALEVDISGKTSDPKANKEVVEEKEEEYELEIIDDTPKADRNRKVSEPPADVTDEELEQYSEKVRNRIKHFNKGYHDERRAKESAQREREELERYAQRLVDENKELKGSVTKNQNALLEQAKKNTTVEVAQAKEAYRSAHETGDTDALVEAQDQLTTAKLRADKLDNFEVPALQDEETPVQIGEYDTRTPTVETDLKAEAWQKANSWFNSDDEMRGYAYGLHTKLIKEGVDPRSDGYYETIDSRMRTTFPDYFQEEPEVGKPKRQSNVVAPATRSTAPKKVTLSKSQQAIANKLGVTYAQYAEQVAQLERGE
jgi:hypothetical protein